MHNSDILNELNNILLSHGITSTTTDIDNNTINTIINEIQNNPALAPLVENNPALSELLKTAVKRNGGTRYKKTRKQKGGTRYKKIRTQKGGINFALFLAALTYPFLGATHAPGPDTLAFKDLRILAGIARAEEAAKASQQTAIKEGKKNITKKYPLNQSAYSLFNKPESSINTSKISTVNYQI